MNPVNLFPRTLRRILEEPVINFIEEIEGDEDALKAFFEAQEQGKVKAEQAKKNYDNFEENSKQPFAPKFFCSEFEEIEPERHSSSEESARSHSPDPDSKPTCLIPELDIKRGFGLAEHPYFQSLSSLTINPPLQKGVRELIKKFDDPEANKKSASRIGEMAKSLIENTQKLRAKISEDSRRELEIEEEVIKEDHKLPPENLKMEKILSTAPVIEIIPLNQNQVQSNGNQGFGEKIVKKSDTQHSAKRSINKKRLEFLETIYEETSEEASEETYQSNPGNLQQNFEIGVTAELGFEVKPFSNRSYVQSGGGPEIYSQNESEADIKSSCLEKFSCVRLENLNKNCSIS
jgi:hypothetical protein